MRKEGSFYVYLQKRLLENCDGDKVLDTMVAKWKIINMKIPKLLVWMILEDMEQMGMGERIGKFKFKIKNVRKDDKIEEIITNCVR